MQKLRPSPHNALQLPVPDDAALAASSALCELLHAEIARQHGYISFADYMETVLYAPRLGYYSGGATKLGQHGDFTTAPEMSALFGATLAQLASQLFAQTGAQVMEFGAGSGKLAFDFLTECQRNQVLVERYFIVELSGELRARQEALLQPFPQVVWLQAMPAAFSGVVLGNEVLDAMPVQLVMKTDSGWHECGVVFDDDQALMLSTNPQRAAGTEAASVNIAQIPEPDALPIGYLTETHQIAQAFMRSVSDMLLAGQRASGLGGVAIWIDYGFPAREYYLAQRAQGTLMCHYRHHAHPNPFYLPGLQDITAHVDFTAMAQAALDAGLDLLAYTSQAAFLLGAGIADLLTRTPSDDVRTYLPVANALQKLISPAEMGELFKVLVVGCAVQLPEALLRHDRSHRL
jgi:SAM-dependent MidA family methyltransferase